MFFKFIKSKELIFTLVLFTVLRFVAVLLMELSPQDAYYSYYSENLALSYFDHPPMVAYMIWFFSIFLGRSEVALHVTNFIVTYGTIWFTFLCFKPFLTRVQKNWLLILLFSAPYVTILSINTTPDIPLLFFWSLSLFVFRCILFGRGSGASNVVGNVIGSGSGVGSGNVIGSGNGVGSGVVSGASNVIGSCNGVGSGNVIGSGIGVGSGNVIGSGIGSGGAWYLWVIAGLTSGFAFDSKYTGVFLPFSFILFLLLSKEHRKFLISWRFFVYVLAFLVAISPVVIWNVQNEFISFKYQSSERASDIALFVFKPKFFFGFIASQLAIALPILLFWMYRGSFVVLLSWGKSVFTGKSVFKRESTRGEMSDDKVQGGDDLCEDGQSYKVQGGADLCEDGRLLFLVCFVAPLLFLFTAISAIYWVKINWIMPTFLAGSILTAIYMGRSFLRVQTVFSLILHVGLVVQLIWMPFKIKSDDTWWGWDDLADKTELVKESTDSQFIFSDNSYKVSAALNFYLKEHVYGGNVIDNFAYQFELDNPDLSYLKDKDAVYVLSDRFKRQILKRSTVEQVLSGYFESVILVDSLILFDRDGDEFKRFYFYDCEDYSPEGGLNSEGGLN